MSIGAVLSLIAESYPRALSQRYARHPVAELVRHELKAAISHCLGDGARHYVIKGSAGAGRWTTSPWAAIMSPVVTSSAEGGYYPVFLYSSDFSEVSLVMGQGTSDVRQEFGAKVNEIIKMRAELLRRRVPEFSEGRFHEGPFKIQTATGAGGDWGLTSAWGVSYKTNDLPSDEIIRADIVEMVRLYHVAMLRGGFDLISDSPEEPDPGSQSDREKSIDGELRRKLHDRIERVRNKKLVTQAKRHHGTLCQGCGFDFSNVYGADGDGYIEAHHLVPLASITIDGPISLDPETDFAVLCANCHRMIHRLGCPPLVEFQQAVSDRFRQLIKAIRK